MSIEVDNVLIYVDDAVRYDAAEQSLSQRGALYKAVAASTHTPTSFGSILTGIYPPKTGIKSFAHTVNPSVKSIFDSDTNVAMDSHGGMNETIANLFATAEQRPLSDVSSPFIHVVRRPGGHAPYNGFELDVHGFENNGLTGMEYFKQRASSPDRMREDYYAAVDASLGTFDDVLGWLRSQGLAESTLVIYLSDHGETLGEYGYFGHSHLSVPENIYVPMAFIHPDINAGKRDTLLHHVDLLPTVQQVLKREIDIGATDGTPFGEGRDVGYSYFEHVNYGPSRITDELTKRTANRIVKGVWGENGGHTFTSGSLLQQMVIAGGLFTMTGVGPQLLATKRIRPFLRHYRRGHKEYGSLDISQSEARSRVERILSVDTVDTKQEIDEETQEQLHDMGYM